METLADRIAREGPLNELDAVGWAIRLAKRIESMHALGVTHGSVSPQCVQIEGKDRTARAYLVDVRRTSSGIGYHSPERMNGGALSQADDTWALACTLYAALTGNAPFSGVNDAEVQHKVLASSPAPLAVFDVGDDDLQRVFDDAFAREQGHRTVAVSALRAALEEWHPDPNVSGLPGLEDEDTEGGMAGDDEDEDERTIMRPAPAFFNARLAPSAAAPTAAASAAAAPAAAASTAAASAAAGSTAAAQPAVPAPVAPPRAVPPPAPPAPRAPSPGTVPLPRASSPGVVPPPRPPGPGVVPPPRAPSPGAVPPPRAPFAGGAPGLSPFAQPRTGPAARAVPPPRASSPGLAGPPVPPARVSGPGLAPPARAGSSPDFAGPAARAGSSPDFPAPFGRAASSPDLPGPSARAGSSPDLPAPFGHAAPPADLPAPFGHAAPPADLPAPFGHAAPAADLPAPFGPPAGLVQDPLPPGDEEDEDEKTMMRSVPERLAAAMRGRPGDASGANEDVRTTARSGAFAAAAPTKSGAFPAMVSPPEIDGAGDDPEEEATRMMQSPVFAPPPDDDEPKTIMHTSTPADEAERPQGIGMPEPPNAPLPAAGPATPEAQPNFAATVALDALGFAPPPPEPGFAPAVDPNAAKGAGDAPFPASGGGAFAPFTEAVSPGQLPAPGAFGAAPLAAPGSAAPLETTRRGSGLWIAMVLLILIAAGATFFFLRFR